MNARDVTLAAVLATFGWATPAAAFCRSTTCRGDCPLGPDGCPTGGHPLFWPGTCVGYSLQKDGTASLDLGAVRVVVQRSFAAWSDVPCPAAGGAFASMTFSELEDAACHLPQYNAEGPNVNVVFFKDNDWTYKGIDGTLATTTVTFDDRTGEIFDADVAINTSENDMTIGDASVSYDLQSIVTHEVGHFIGVAHSPLPTATMYASYAPGTTAQRALSADDVSAVCAIYPPGRAGTCDPTPRGGLGTTCAPAAPAASGCAAAGETASVRGEIVALSIVAAAAIRRRKRLRTCG